MHSFEELHKIINDYLDNYKINKKPANLYEPINYVLSIGGKRIRPILCLMACEMFADSYKLAINAALGLEIFHNFTLLHDDIMDNAEIRRGKPVVHKKWNKNIALLSGDAMTIIAYQNIAKIESGLEKCLEVFSDTALKICEGQQIDMDFETDDKVNIAEYLEMINLKTAVLIACCLKIGAIAGGANNEIADKMYDVGINLGMAFQLQDDYLDVFGKPEVFGKNIGGDIVANKKTYLLVSAMQSAEGKQKDELNDWIKNQNSDNETKIKAVTEIYKNLNIDNLCKSEITKYLNAALESLNEIKIEEEKKALLNEFILMLENRNY
ncbi:MAG: polyprenyl synthetase family protein [Bacteroidales bacterium]|nr:polyprenyl synthetase family protein [Bacteroidales bacterium]